MKLSHFFKNGYSFSFFVIILLSSSYLMSCSEQGTNNKTSGQSKSSNPQTNASTAPIDYTQNKELYEKVVRAQTLLDEYFGKGNNETEAARLIEKVLQADENYVPALLIKAKLTMRESCLSDCKSQINAAVIIEKALTLDPVYADTYVLAGQVNSLIGNYDKARNLFDKAKSMGTSNPWLYYNIGYMYYSQRDYTPADLYFEKVVNNGPGNTSQQLKAYISALYLQQEMAYQNSQSDRLLSLAKKTMIAAHPKDAWSRGNSANFLCREGFFDEGIEFTKNALSIMQYGRAYQYLSFCYYGKWAELTMEGKTEEAEQYFNEAYALDPDIKKIAEDFSGCGQKLRDLRPVFNERIETMEASKEAALMGVEL